MTQIDITTGSLELFKAYAHDAGNWSGNPLVGGNVRQTPEHNGYLTHLKKLGLVKTFSEGGCVWIKFTEFGKMYAAEMGIVITE